MLSVFGYLYCNLNRKRTVLGWGLLLFVGFGWVGDCLLGFGRGVFVVYLKFLFKIDLFLPLSLYYLPFNRIIVPGVVKTNSVLINS